MEKSLPRAPVRRLVLQCPTPRKIDFRLSDMGYGGSVQHFATRRYSGETLQEQYSGSLGRPIEISRSFSERQHDMETRSRAVQTFCPNPAVVSLYDRSSDRESHTHPLGLCREERLENFLQPICRDARAFILYLDFTKIVPHFRLYCGPPLLPPTQHLTC